MGLKTPKEHPETQGVYFFGNIMSPDLLETCMGILKHKRFFASNIDVFEDIYIYIYI